MWFLLCFTVISGQSFVETRLKLALERALPLLCAQVAQQDCSKVRILNKRFSAYFTLSHCPFFFPQFTFDELLKSIGSNQQEYAQVVKLFEEGQEFLNSAPTKSCTVNDDNLKIFYSVRVDQPFCKKLRILNKNFY